MNTKLWHNFKKKIWHNFQTYIVNVKTAKGIVWTKCIMWRNNYFKKCKFISKFSGLVTSHQTLIYNGIFLKLYHTACQSKFDLRGKKISLNIFSFLISVFFFFFNSTKISFLKIYNLYYRSVIKDKILIIAAEMVLLIISVVLLLFFFNWNAIFLFYIDVFKIFC